VIEGRKVGQSTTALAVVVPRKGLVTTRAFCICTLLVAGCAGLSGEGKPGTPALSKAQRLAYVREAVVWSPIDTRSSDIRRGPELEGLEAGSLLECEFVLPDAMPGGQTPKFFCRAHDGTVYKVKYGRENRELYGEVIGTRLLWALGFKSDRVDPVRVRCKGCPEDPWEFMKREADFGEPGSIGGAETRDFVPAVVESYFGSLIEASEDQGVDWDEILGLLSSDPKRAAEQRMHREALTLLAGFLQYADSKPSNQTLSCAPGGDAREGGRCTRPTIYLGDMGAILGEGWNTLRMRTTKVDYADWSEVPVWRDPEGCVAAVNGRPNASLRDTRVSEAGRSFLAERLSLLRREQLRALFELSRVELLGEELEGGDGASRAVTPDDWADLFLAKAKSITEHSCPASVR
jgi:hypothetical protein